MNKHMPSKRPGPLDVLAAAVLLTCIGGLVCMGMGWL